MRIVNLGSLNYDKVYEVPHFVAEGETIPAQSCAEFLGGKGLNQSLALARAGAQVCHAGAVGADGGPLRDCLAAAGVDVSCLQQLDTVSGHAIIQNAAGKNCIIVFGGANQRIEPDYISSVLQRFEPGDILLLQNETSNVPFAIREAKRLGLRVAFNASPITDGLLRYPLELVDFFLVNEIEGRALAGIRETDFEAILSALAARYPRAVIVLTVGEQGVLCAADGVRAAHGAYRVEAVDTTAAGDTFCGYFLAGVAAGLPVEDCLEQASKASAIAVGRHGASVSIPLRGEVERFSGTLRDV